MHHYRRAIQPNGEYCEDCGATIKDREVFHSKERDCYTCEECEDRAFDLADDQRQHEQYLSEHM